MICDSMKRGYGSGIVGGVSGVVVEILLTLTCTSNHVVVFACSDTYLVSQDVKTKFTCWN